MKYHRNTHPQNQIDRGIGRSLRRTGPGQNAPVITTRRALGGGGGAESVCMCEGAAFLSHMSSWWTNWSAAGSRSVL